MQLFCLIQRPSRRWRVAVACLALAWWSISCVAMAAESVDRSPVDLVLSLDEERFVTVNQTAGTLSLVRTESGEIVDEVPCGQRPTGVALAPDGKRLAATATYSGELFIFDLVDDRLAPVGEVYLGFEPRGVAISPDGRLAYVALTSADQVAVVDLAAGEVLKRIAVGRWPRTLALSPDGRRLAVGASGAGGVSVVDADTRTLAFEENFVGLNLGQMQITPDGMYVYFPWISYRANPITPGNIREGWVTASRIARVRLDEHTRRDAIALDPKGDAVGDPFGMGLTSDGQWLIASASGTHELLVYHLPTLVFQDYGGPGDHIDPGLLDHAERFFRIPLGGRPMALRVARDDRRVFVANYLANAVQVVDLKDRRVARTIALGGPSEPSLARRGEAIFYDAERSLDHWYSCHTCHWEGDGNSVTMDTHNDGSTFTYKAVKSLHDVRHTAPWTWHGWQTDLSAAMRKSLIDTMLGPKPTDADVEALIAFLDTLDRPPNPHRTREGALTAAARRGEDVFNGDRAGCATCHGGPHFTDGEVHDVGLGGVTDRYDGYNTPSLVGVHNRLHYLHDGRAKSLEDLLTGAHRPDKVAGAGELTTEELHDLIAYLRSL